MLEDKNILINAEAIKSVDYLVRILKSNFPQSKLKHILTLIIEKVIITFIIYFLNLIKARC